jgi:hypothetical protein
MSAGPRGRRRRAAPGYRQGRRGRCRPAGRHRRAPTAAGGKRPHGIRVLPSPARQAKATSRPPPVACSADTSPHSAHSPSRRRRSRRCSR